MLICTCFSVRNLNKRKQNYNELVVRGFVFRRMKAFYRPRVLL